MERTYKVTVESYDIIIYYDDYEIEAESEQEAKELALSGDFVEVGGDTSYCEGSEKLMKEIIEKDFRSTVTEVEDVTDEIKAKKKALLENRLELKQKELNNLKKELEAL